MQTDAAAGGAGPTDTADGAAGSTGRTSGAGTEGPPPGLSVEELGATLIKAAKLMLKHNPVVSGLYTHYKHVTPAMASIAGVNEARGAS